uniref:Uncharacterized protein n=1 Tax=Anguilla anguilla TaxID=7936 RepID=A0A0E9WE14_ANGAN
MMLGDRTQRCLCPTGAPPADTWVLCSEAGGGL